MKTSRTIFVSMPPEQLRETEKAAKRDKRALSGRRVGRSDLDPMMGLIAEAAASPMPPAELRTEAASLASYGSRQAKRAGIKERDIPGIIRASRSRQRPA